MRAGDATLTVHGALVVLGVLAIVLAVDAAVAAAVYRDAQRRPGRAPGLDAALAFAFPVGGWLIYLRSANAASQPARPPGSPAADPARPPSSADLLPRLTEELRLARAEAAHWRQVAGQLQAEVDRRQ
ncbi:MAG: hypothetical protein M3Z02_04505 [Actinomycetota bacterium]|nr:hypothetical protein [Actinomycetota bacterium]